MSVIALAGDWHGNQAWACSKIEEVAGFGVEWILQTGGFGLTGGKATAAYLEAVDQACRHFGVRVWITPGNYDNWSPVGDLLGLAGDGASPTWIGSQLAVLPRGYRFEIEGRSFVSVGGAPAIDYAAGSSVAGWWQEEMITEDDVTEVASGGYADVMLAHDAAIAPYEVDGVANLRSHRERWSVRASVRARVGARRMTDALLAVGPSLFVHGHYHATGEKEVTLPGRSYTTSVWSLNAAGSRGNLRYLDLETLSRAPAAEAG